MTSGGRTDAYAEPVSQSTRLHDRVVETIGARIVVGELAPGSLVVPELVRAEFGVSASVVREAFRVLQEKRLLKAKSKVGTTVLPASRWNFLDLQVIQWRIESDHRHEQIAEFFEFRLAVEPVAAQLMADRGAAMAVSRLRACVTRMKQAIERNDLPAFATADIDFHATLVAESGNQMFATLRGIVELAGAVHETFSFPVSDPANHGPDLHDRLVNDITSGSGTAWVTARELLTGAWDEMRDEASLKAPAR